MNGYDFLLVMLSEFEKTIADFIEAQGLFSPGDRVVAAVSGGADSVAMLHVLCRLGREGALHIAPTVVHINHNLRPQADDDGRFVQSLAETLGLAAEIQSVDVRGFAAQNKLSIETAGRQLRMAGLSKAAKKSGASLIATAHHSDDNVETVIHRLLRGTGPGGLCGIWPRRTFDNGLTMVRPMLCVSRGQIIAYCRDSGLNWRHDHTNDEVAYTRNRIRHLLLPEIRGDSPEIDGLLSRLSLSAQRLQTRIESETDSAWKQIASGCDGGRVVFNLEGFNTSAKLVRVELVRRAFHALGRGLGDVTEGHYDRIMHLAAGRAGGRQQLPAGLVVCRESDGLIFARQPGPEHEYKRAQPVVLDVPGVATFGRWRIEASLLDAGGCDIEAFKTQKDCFVEWFDADRIAGPIIVRQREASDRFWPLGMVGDKKVGKFLTAAGLDRQRRAEVVVVHDSEKIIWVAPVRAGHGSRVVPATGRILQVQLMPKTS